MGTPKENVRNLLDMLPDDATLVEIGDHIRIMQKVEETIESRRWDGEECSRALGHRVFEWLAD
jgi:hypothetical protein